MIRNPVGMLHREGEYIPRQNKRILLLIIPDNVNLPIRPPNSRGRLWNQPVQDPIHRDRQWMGLGKNAPAFCSEDLSV